MSKIKDETILKIVDTFDECSMLYFDATTNELYEGTSISNYDVERPHSNFYECLIKVINYFLDHENLDLKEEEIAKQIENKINDLKTYLETNGVNSEEIRRALLLLDIKGFKNVNFPLDFITPDAISLIVTELVKYTTPNLKKINLLDFNFGIGNLSFTIVNHLDKEVELVGIDNHPLMANVACCKANLMDTKLNIYNEDALAIMPSQIDIVVSDIASYDYENDYYTSKLYDEGVRYFPYLAIEHYLKLEKPTKYIYLIDDDFFMQPGSDKFKTLIKEKGNILCLIALPNSFFIEGTTHKSVLIMDNIPSSNITKTEVYMLPKLQDKVAFLNVMKSIEQYLKNN